MLSLALICCLGQVGPPVPPPPPPVKKEPEKPKIPERIRVGGQVYTGPGYRWSSTAELSDVEFAHLQRQLLESPSDICLTGALIAWTSQEQTKQYPRTDHIVWMIEHHPGWDGFRFQGQRPFSVPRSAEEFARFGEIKSAWKRQTALAEQKGDHLLLATAGVFLSIMEPNDAEALLKSALRIEPHNRDYADALGRVYALATLPRREAYWPPADPKARSKWFASNDARVASGGGRLFWDFGHYDPLLRAKYVAHLRTLPMVPTHLTWWTPSEPPQIPCPSVYRPPR